MVLIPVPWGSLDAVSQELQGQETFLGMFMNSSVHPDKFWNKQEGFEFLTASSMKMIVFWVVAPPGLV
jgi:hypothetical protein